MSERGAEERIPVELLEEHRQRGEELESARRQLAELARELDDTNHGVIALHAELEAAREAEAHLAAIVRFSEDAMLSLARDLTVTSWNPGAEALLGYDASEIVGRPVHLIVPDEAGEELETAVKRIESGERVAPFDTWRRRKDGSLVEVAVTLSAIRNASGELTGFSAVMADLTQRREAEEELAVARAETEVFAERDRIGRDLHDLVIQRLFADGLSLQAVLSMEPRPEIAGRIARIVDDLDVTIREIRTTIFALGRSPKLATTLRSQLLEVAAEASTGLGFQARTHFDGPVDAMVPDRVAAHVVAVAREALSNVARHAHASRVDIELAVRGDEVQLVVVDDGVGPGRSTRRSGLANLAERADLLGGTFEVRRAEPNGTCVEWRVPVVPAAASDGPTSGGASAG